MRSYASSFDYFSTIVLAVTAVLLVAVFAAIVSVTLPKGPPVFAKGDLVRMRLGGATGMIVNSICEGNGCRYAVRFPSIEIRTNTRLLASDDAVTLSPVSLVHGIMEFELEPAK